MKKGFTMIELIFVIVILGILAATAIPKLNATRDDARMVTAAQEADRIFSELGGYYTAQGAFHTDFNATDSDDVSGMTNVSNPIKLGTDECLRVRSGNQGTYPGQVKVEIGTGGLCGKLWLTAAMQQVSKSFFDGPDMNTSFPSKYGKQNYKFDPKAAGVSSAYTTFGTNTGINFEN